MSNNFMRLLAWVRRKTKPTADLTFAEKIECLNEKIHSKISNLNHGGCGIFCYLMYKKLKMLGYNPRIIAFNGDSIDSQLTNITNCLENKPYEILMACNHFILECNGVFFDGYNWEEEAERFGYGRITGYYNITQLQVALDNGGWNSVYERKHNQTLANLINDFN